MTNALIDSTVILEALSEAVRGNEDKRSYCQYQYDPADMGEAEEHGQTAHCIAGQALKDLGFELPQGKDNDEQFIILYGRPDSLFGKCFTELAAHILSDAQDRQDNGQTWGEALSHVESVLAVGAYQDLDDTPPGETHVIAPVGIQSGEGFGNP